MDGWLPNLWNDDDADVPELISWENATDPVAKKARKLRQVRKTLVNDDNAYQAFLNSCKLD